MLICPNKNAQEWKLLSAKIGEDQAYLAFFRNGNMIPSVETAMSLLSNKGVMMSLENIPSLSEDTVINTLLSQGLVTEESMEEDGKTWHKMNTMEPEIATKLGNFTNQYGSVLDYKNDYVTVNAASIESWNRFASNQNRPNQDLTQLARNFLSRIGVSVTSQNNVLSEFGANAVADFAKRMVIIQSGAENAALPEEALHFFLDMLPQDDPVLMEAMDKIRGLDIYKKTLEQYKNNPNYRTKDGQVRFEKIKKEALAKELANRMSDKTDNLFTRLLKKIMDWIRSRKLQKDPIDMIAEMFYAQDISRLNLNLTSDEIYNQMDESEKNYYEAQPMNSEQKAALNKLMAHTSLINFNKEEHILTQSTMTGDPVVMKSVTSVLGSDFSSELENPDVMMEIIDNFRDEFPDVMDYNLDDTANAKRLIDHILFQIATNELNEEALEQTIGKKIGDLLFKASESKQKTLFGTAIHSVAEAVILGKELDLDAVDPNVYKMLDRKTLERLIYGTVSEKGILQTLKDIVADGSVLVSELQVGNGKLGGIIDIVALRPDGSVDIYDFKTKYIREYAGAKEDLQEEFMSVINLNSKIGVKREANTIPELISRKRKLIEKYTQQMSLYKRLLMETGVPVGTLNVIGIPYRLNAQNRVSEIKIQNVNNLPYNSKLGTFLFSPIDENMDAVNKKVELPEDERVKLLDSIDKIKMKETFARSLARLEQLYSYYSRNKDAKAIYDLLTDDATGTNKLKIQQSMVKSTMENFDEVADYLTIQKNFLELIDSSVDIIKEVNKAFSELRAKTSPTKEAAAQRLNELMKMRDFLVGYQDMFEQFLLAIGSTDQENPVVKTLTNLTGVITSIRKEYVSTITPVVGGMLGDAFTKELVDNMKREYTEMIVAARQRGDKKLEETLTKERNDLASDEVIMATLTGGKGDVGWFLGKYIATASNPDVILGSVAKSLKHTLDRVRLKNKELRDQTSKEFTKRADVYGRGLDIKTINKSLVYTTTTLDPYTGKEMEQMFFKSEFHERLYYDYAKLQQNLAKAELTKDKEQIKEAKKEKKAFETKYFETPFTEEYQRLVKPLETEVMYQGRKTTVREIRDSIMQNIRSINGIYGSQRSEGKMDDIHVKQLRENWETYYALKEKRDNNNQPKSGEALKIALALEEYEKNSKLLYTTTVDNDMYTRISEKKKLEYGENSAQYKQWLEENTIQSVTDEYFDKLQELMDEKAQILQNPQADRLAEISRELRLLTAPYKDADGVVRAQLLTKEKAEKMKMLEYEKKQLNDTSEVISLNGYTPEEQLELNKLFYLKNNGHPYDKRAISLIMETAKTRLELRMIDDPELAQKIKRLQEINGQLKGMSTMQETKYYYEELEKQEVLFAEAQGISWDELKENEDKYDEFRQTDWFLQNHNMTFTVLYENSEGEQEGYRTIDPIYAWKRFVPAEQYVKRVPGRHFSIRTDNKSYTNDKGEEIQLLNDDIRDVRNRLRPKTNEQYRKQYGVDHPYINDEYRKLKTKVDSRVATVQEKVDYENLTFITEKMLSAQEDIEMSQRLGLAVPFLEKNLQERTIESKFGNIKDGVKEKSTSIMEGLQRMVTRTEQDLDQEGIAPTTSDVSKLATVDNNEVKFVPVRFSTRGEASNASYDVWGGMLNYVSSINRKKELQKELAMVNGLEEILAAPGNQPKGETNNLIINNIYKKYIPELSQRLNQGTNTRLEVLKSFINSVMYNEEYFTGYDVLGVNTQKAVSNLMKLGSFTMMGMAPFNWTVNLISGNIQNLVEASGGQYFTMKEFARDKAQLYADAGGKYGSVVKDMMVDYGKLGNRSFWGQIIEVFDPLQGEFEDEYGKNTKFNKVKNIMELGMFAGKVWGEWEIQMSAAISFLKNNRLHNGKVVDKETFITMVSGINDQMNLDEIKNRKLDALQQWEKLDVNVLDMLELNKQGILAVKDQYKDAFELGSREFSDIVAKLHAMQKKINGSYNKFDKAYVEKTSLGRLMFFFRKYLIPLGMNRFGVRRANYEAMSVEEGFYLTFLKSFGKDLAKFRLNIAKNWNNYSDFEKRAIKKTLTDLAAIMSLWAMYSLLFGYDPDDPEAIEKLRKKGFGAQASVFLLLKIKSETEQFMPLPGAGFNEIKRVYTNPSLIFGQITQYMKISKLMIDHATDVIPGIDNSTSLYYQQDVDETGLRDEGDSKLISNVLRTFGGYTGRTFHPIDLVKSFKTNDRL